MTKRFEDEANGQEELLATGDIERQDEELRQALTDFRSSVHAWSDAAFSRPRPMAPPVRMRSWRPALGWAMGCLLLTGAVSGGLYERHHMIFVAQVAERQRMEDQQRQLRERQNERLTDEALLTDVDSDVSRQVPSALEPLAQMMTDETK